jgi:RNA polymerase sigma factor (TIGR02999 family)
LTTHRTDEDVTRLLAEWRDGDAAALDRVMPVVHRELKRVAERLLSRERSEHTLQATALVNEAYLRLVDQRSARWESRTHFFAISARMMRRILIDHARAHLAARRGSGVVPQSLDEVAVVGPEPDPQLIAIDEALTRLEAIDPRQGRIVELRFFAGLTVEEAAAALDTSPRTVKREWRMARAWLARELGEGVARDG